MTTARLEVRDLSVGHDGIVVAGGIALRVDPGEIVAILGPSGSGKSTLLSTIAGVVAPLSGRVLVDAVDVTTMPVHRRRIGLIFQEPLLFAHLSVGGNVAYGMRRQGVERRQARRRAAELLAWVGLPGYEGRRSDQLSGGQAQRVALARALGADPSVLLLDEPFSALDAELRGRLAVEVAARLRDAGVAALHVTHDAAEAEAVADRVVTIDELAR